MAVAQSFTSNVPRDLKGGVSVTPFPIYVNHRVVTAAETETVPAGATIVVIGADVGIWVSDGTAQVPASDVTDGTGSFYLAAGVSEPFYVTPAQTISVIASAGTANVSFRYYIR